MYIPTESEFLGGIRLYDQRERRGPVYFEALRLIQEGWGDALAVADGIGRLLKSWHLNFYRFGMYAQDKLEDCLSENLAVLDAIHERSTASLGQEDEEMIRSLFGQFTTALRGGKHGQRESTVATAKAMHLLAPDFLPLWDTSIASVYGQLPMFAGNYVAFCWQMRDFAAATTAYIVKPDDRTLLKRVDEFNYSAYTTHWIDVGGTS